MYWLQNVEPFSKAQWICGNAIKYNINSFFNDGVPENFM